MLKNGIPIEIIQKILGHADIKTTQIYAQVLEDVLLKEMGKLSYEWHLQNALMWSIMRIVK